MKITLSKDDLVSILYQRFKYVIEDDSTIDVRIDDLASEGRLFNVYITEELSKERKAKRKESPNK